MALLNNQTNRNVKKRVKFSGSLGYASDNNESITEIYLIDSVADNFYISTPIPGSDHQYRWITASILIDDRELFPYSYATSSTDLVIVSSSVWFDGTHENYLSPIGSPTLISFDPNSPSTIETTPAYYDVNTSSYTVSLVGDGVITIEEEAQRKYISLLNGPYQYPTWKQVRPKDHPVWRSLLKESFMLISKDSPTTYNGVKQIKAKRNPEQDYYHVPFITNRFNRMRFAFEELEKFANSEIVKPTYIEFDYGSVITYFTNQQIDDKLNVPQKRSLVFDAIYQNYNKNLDSNIGNFISIVYKEKIWPKEDNTFLQRTRDRKLFAFNWKDKRVDRRTLDSQTTFGGTNVTSSLWPLDARPDYDTNSLVTTASTIMPGDVGELSSVTNYFHNGDVTRLTASACFTYPAFAGTLNASNDVGIFWTNDTKFKP